MRKFLCLGAFLCFLSAGARDAGADTAVSFVLGTNIGGNLTALTEGGNLDLRTSFENSPLYGVRVGTYGFPIGFEGSLIYSPSALVGSADGQVEANTNILYTEANVLVILLPGPVSPFVTGGVGLHYFDFNIADFLKFSKAKLGWNWGGGVKMNVSRAALRFDIRDHITTFGLDDFGISDIGGLLGLSKTDARIHNVEVSFSIGIRF